MLTHWLRVHHPEILDFFLRTDDSDRSGIETDITRVFEECKTIVFVDLAGFTSKCRNLGIASALHWILIAENIAIRFSDDHNGELVKSSGDSWMLAFSDCSDAMKFVLKYSEHLRILESAATSHPPIIPCIGMDSGSILRFGEHEMYGEPVNTASLLGEDIAKPWQILMTEKMAIDLASNGMGDCIQRFYVEPESKGMAMYEWVGNMAR